MPITFGPRNIRDDRGKVITGRSINELLGDVRVEAGKRWFSWRMIGGLSILAVFGYANVARVLYQSATSSNTLDLWIFAIFGTVILLGFVSGMLRRWRNRSGSPEPQERSEPSELDQAVAAELVASQRCGACGYGLRKNGVQSDGCVVCSECGAAWHESRLQETPADADGVSRAVEKTLKNHDRVGYHPTDDRYVPTGIATHTGRSDGQQASSARGAAVVRILNAQVLRQRTTWAGGLSVAGVVTLITGIILHNPRTDTGAFVMYVGICLIIAALCTLALSSRWTERKLFFLSYRVCPACLGELPVTPALDGRVACTVCGAAWMAGSLGNKVVTEAQLAKVTIPCTRCGYNRNGLADSTPCPECGLGAATPPGNPHCAACDTPLESPTRVCPRCMYQAGVEYH